MAFVVDNSVVCGWVYRQSEYGLHRGGRFALA